MKKIALIRNSYSYDIGGAEKFPINLGEILISKGYYCELATSNKTVLSMAKDAGLPTNKSPWWSHQNFSGLGILLFPVYLMWQLILTIWYIAYFLKNKIDVAHPQSRDDFISATFAARILNRKVVWSDHADLKHVYMNHRVWYKNPIGKLVYLASKFADFVALESLSEKRLIEESLGNKIPDNYKVIYIGVVDRKKKPSKKNNKLVLVSTSRLVKDKGIGELIEAFKIIEHPLITLKVCGDGPDAEFFKKKAKKLKNVKFLGHVNNVDEILDEADILIHPTYHEGFGLSLVEAEMHSLPIIATDVGSIPEIVNDGVSGILVPAKNSIVLADAIKTLANDPSARLRMGSAGRKIYLEKFQFDKIVVDKIIPIYEGKE